MVAPLSILGVWEDEFERFAAFDYNLAVLSGTGARKADTIRHMNGAALQVLVVNYESAWRLEKELSAWKPDCIVCDEGHKIKTHNIAASRALHRLGAKAKYRLLLTGTVITNKPIDVFSGDFDNFQIVKISCKATNFAAGKISFSTNSPTLRSTATVSTCSATATSTWWAMATTRR